MREIARQLRRWIHEGVPFALATIVATDGSSPRAAGTSMAVAPGPLVIGDVSGGCVEAAVVELCQEVLESGTSRRQRFGVSDEMAFSVGLTCGGEIDIFVQPIHREEARTLELASEAILGGKPVAVATPLNAGTSQLVIDTDQAYGTLGQEGLDVAVTDDASGMLEQGATGIRRYGPHGERRMDDVEVFVASFAQPPQLMVFGTTDFAGAVVRMGKFLGYRVTLCDPRGVFATRQRFPEADEIVVDWPHRFLASATVDGRTIICVLTHDPKFDVPALEVALQTPAAYIGVMGSRRTHDDRMARLRAAGFEDRELARLRSPIGLDIGARTPEEVAVSIAAEIIAERWGGSGLPLRLTGGRVHDSSRTRIAVAQ